MSRELRTRIKQFKDELGISKVPTVAPVPIEWLLKLELGTLTEPERDKLKEMIREREAIQPAPSKEYTDMIEHHRIEVEQMADAIEDLHFIDPIILAERLP